MLIEGKCGSCGTSILVGDQALVSRKKLELIAAVISAAQVAAPLFEERVRNTTKNEWGFDPYSGAVQLLNKSLETLTGEY